VQHVEVVVGVAAAGVGFIVVVETTFGQAAWPQSSFKTECV
jgi:hypothetical protein